MKKLLLLGGSTQQIPAITYAKSQGYQTILCDFLIDNPGQDEADMFYCVSTTDKEAILAVAEKEKVDGVVAYASDPAAPTAAYVAEKLGLPTNPYQSVEILSYKDKFRTFLEHHDFHCPHAQSFTTYEEAKEAVSGFRFPIIVKPIDSSGSKGVRKIVSMAEMEEAFSIALEQSRSKKVIMEEFIVKDHPYMIAGDCFVIDGKVAYWGFLNSHRDTNVNPFVPVGTSYPIASDEKRLEVMKATVQRLMDVLAIKFGAFNMEMMFDGQGQLYIIEMGPRNGGNMIPDLLYMATGIDMVAATIETALGGTYHFQPKANEQKYLATHVLHTNKNGLLKDVFFHEEIAGKITKKIMYKEKDDLVQFFDGSNKAIGIIFWQFDSMEEMLEKMDHSEKWLKVVVE